MHNGRQIIFPPFCLDTRTEQLWHGSSPIYLRPKTFAVLRYLAESQDCLITKEELFDSVWQGIVVSDVVLRTAVQEIRQALGDDSKAPRFIETVHKRGYRFIAKTSALQKSKEDVVPRSGSPAFLPHFVGREEELDQLDSCLQKALSGQRQIVFVSGEAGIGKTTLVDAFLGRLAATQAMWIGRGQCIEQYGPGEAYLPVLDALGRLCRSSDSETIIELLGHYAPTWLIHMPALLSAAQLEQLQGKMHGSSPQRMLRELGEACEALATKHPLILVLEDLQWSDYATLDCLSFLAPRREPAQFMLIGTHRTGQGLSGGHPLHAIKRELQAHGQCVAMSLTALSETAAMEYLTRRLPDARDARHSEIARLIHQRTEGNPLFMVAVVDTLLDREKAGHQNGSRPLAHAFEHLEHIVHEIPERLQLLIEKHALRLMPDQQYLLEAASVVGRTFSAAAVAAGTGDAVEVVEESCAQLARSGQFLRACGETEWPDGTIAGCYAFLHAVYRDVFYKRLSPRDQRQFHLRIAVRQEEGYGPRVDEIAAALAGHFEAGRDYERAVHYLQCAAQNAARRYAYREERDYLKRALIWLSRLPDTQERRQQELVLQIRLGAILEIVEDYCLAEAENAYTRAQELCQQVGEPLQMLAVLRGQFDIAFTRGEFQAAYKRGEEALLLADQASDPAFLLSAHTMLGVSALFRGALRTALMHFEQPTPPARFSAYAHVEISRLSHTAMVLLGLGYHDQAVVKMDEVRHLAEESGSPFYRAFAWGCTAWLHCRRQEPQATQAYAETTFSLATDQDLTTWTVQARALQGWALVQQGQAHDGIVQLQQSLDAARTIGAVAMRQILVDLLIDAFRLSGQSQAGLALVPEALAETRRGGQVLQEGALLLLQGELLFGQNAKRQAANRETKAEACFQQARQIAHQQNAKPLELRAVLNLARLWQQQGKKKQARKMLTQIYGWFTEGFDVQELQDARALLAELA